MVGSNSKYLEYISKIGQVERLQVQWPDLLPLLATVESTCRQRNRQYIVNFGLANSAEVQLIHPRVFYDYDSALFQLSGQIDLEAFHFGIYVPLNDINIVKRREAVENTLSKLHFPFSIPLGKEQGYFLFGEEDKEKLSAAIVEILISKNSPKSVHQEMEVAFFSWSNKVNLPFMD